jgi:hypothetical protein
MMDLVEITAARQRIKLKQTQTTHDIKGEDVKNLPLDEVSELIGLKAGVVAQGGELHFRGGRGGEVQYQVDGVPVRDPLVGGGVSLAALAVESADVIMGGLDAQYGNAQSGVVNYKTKEGGQQFEGEIYYLTDDYGQPDNTYDTSTGSSRLRRTSPIKRPYVLHLRGRDSGRMTTPDDRTAQPDEDPELHLGGRPQEQQRPAPGKSPPTGSASYAPTAEMIDNDRAGQPFMPGAGGLRPVVPGHDPDGGGRPAAWTLVPTQVDSTYTYYKRAERVHPDIENRFSQMKPGLDPHDRCETFYSICSRSHFVNDSRAGKQPGIRRRERAGLLLQLPRQRIERLLRDGDYPPSRTAIRR